MVREKESTMTSLQEQARCLRRLTRTDADPRVRHRADALLLVAEGMPIIRTARLLGTSPDRIRVWRDRFLAHGRDGLADQPRPGRPPKLDAAARAILVDALERGPEAFGFPVTVWSVRDLRDLLARRGIAVCAATVHRTLAAMGYRYRRPRHDLTHRQDANAVAAAERVLDWLKRGAPAAVAGFDWSTWTSAKSIPTPGWRRCGNGGDSP
jgi:transposase